MIIPDISIKPDALLNRFILLKPVIYQINDDIFTIKKNFIYDGASIPKIFWSIIGGAFHPDFQKAALLHDYMYRESLGKDKADFYFYEILRHCGVSKIKAKLMYLAVHWFGLKAYDDYKE